MSFGFNLTTIPSSLPTTGILALDNEKNEWVDNSLLVTASSTLPRNSVSPSHSPSQSTSSCTSSSFLLRCLILVLIVSYLIYGSLSIVSFINARSIVTSGNFNTLCRDSSLSSPSPSLSSSPSSLPPFSISSSPGKLVEFCEGFPPSLRFSKFLMFETDAWAVKYAKHVIEHFKDHGNLYLIDVPGAKFSHAIYTSHLTGQPHTNYKGNPISGDSLVSSMKRANPSKTNYSLIYIGPEWSYLSMLGPSSHYNKSFDEVMILNEPLDHSFKHPYPYFFESGDMTDCYKKLFDIKKKGQSLIAHTGIFDHRQHGEHRHQGAQGKKFPFTDRMGDTMQSDFKKLKEWIDDNPEYLLILLSDHGVDEFGLAGYKLHGESSGGNEPFMLVYNPNLEGGTAATGKKEGEGGGGGGGGGGENNKQMGPIHIDVVDVAATLSLYLEGLDIPADSIGVSQPYYGKQHQVLVQKALKQTIYQQTLALQYRGLGLNQDLVEEMLNLEYSKANHIRLLQFASANKERLFSSLEVPWVQILGNGFLGAVVLIFLIFHFNEGIDWFMFSGNYSGLFQELCSNILLYSPMLLQILFCWVRWKGIISGGNLYRLASPFLAFVALRKLRYILMTKEEGGGNRRSSSLHHQTLREIEDLVFWNEVINFAVSFARTILQDLVASVELMPYGREVSLLFALAGVLKYYGSSSLPSSPSPSSSSDVRKSARSTLDWEKWLVVAMIALTQVFEMSEHKEEFYFIFRFHWSAFIVYFVGGFGLFFYLLLFSSRRRLGDLTTPLNMILLLLCKDSSLRTFFLLLFNYQFHHFLVPLLRKTAGELHWTSKETLAEINKKEGRKGLELHCLKQQAFSTCFQTISIYFLNQVFFSFVVGFGERITFDVQPFAGKIGLMDYDGYPILSATLMVIHKYGVFFLFSAYLLRVRIQFIDQDSSSSPSSSSSSGLSVVHSLVSSPPSSSSASSSPSTITPIDHTLLAMVLLFSMSNVGFYLLSSTSGSLPNMPESGTFTVVGGVLGILQCLFGVLFSAKTELERRRLVRWENEKRR